MARALGVSCYEHFTLDHEKSCYISQDENELGAKQIAVLEDAGAVVIDRYKIPIYAHARGVNLSAQSFLLQDPCVHFQKDFAALICLFQDTCKTPLVSSHNAARKVHNSSSTQSLVRVELNIERCRTM
ncbi:hypothetical protein P8452_03307 [Trifolium repens]|nr:hypothetical protein P8452_03307 [Trifolium repens]